MATPTLTVCLQQKANSRLLHQSDLDILITSLYEAHYCLHQHRNIRRNYFTAEIPNIDLSSRELRCYKRVKRKKYPKKKDVGKHVLEWVVVLLTVCAFLFLSGERVKTRIIVCQCSNLREQISSLPVHIRLSSVLWGHKQLTNELDVLTAHISKFNTSVCGIYWAAGRCWKLCTELDSSSLQTFAWVIIS